MATIAKMVIEAILDPKGVRRGLADALAQFDKFKKLNQRKNALGASLFANVNVAGQAQSMLNQLDNEFRQAMNKNKIDLFSGLIDKRKFQQRAFEAAKEFNTNLAQGIQQFSGVTGKGSGAIVDALVDKFKAGGVAAGSAFGRSAQRGIAAHPLLGNLTTTGQRAANTLINGLNQQFNLRMRSLRTDFAEGLISVNHFRTKALQAANEFDRGLSAGLRNLQSKNQATEDITNAIVSQYKLAGLKAANAFQLSAQRQLGSNVKELGTSLTLGVTAPVVAAGAAALKLGADFDLSMRRIQAMIQPTSEQFKNLEKLARRLGATTQFSATDAANAMQILAQQQFSVNQILAATPEIVNLGAAALINLEESAAIATSIMRGFNVQANELGTVMDKIVSGSFQGGGTGAEAIRNLGEALKIAAPGARLFGQSISTTIAALAALARQSHTGTLGGTALRNIFLRLVNPANEAKKALHELGIEQKDLLDGNGGLRDIVEVVELFERAQRRAKGQTEEFNRRLADIFQTRAFTGFSILLQTGSEGLRKMRDNLNAAGGTAERVGKVQMGGLTGALRELVNSLQELAFALNQSGFFDAMTNFVRFVANAVDVLSKFSPTTFRVVTILGLMAAAFGPVLLAIGQFITTLTVARAILIFMNGPKGLLGLLSNLKAFGTITIVIGLLATAIALLTKRMVEAKEAQEGFTNSLQGKSVETLEGWNKNLNDRLELETKYLDFLKARETAEKNAVAASNEAAKKNSRTLSQAQQALEQGTKNMVPPEVTAALKKQQDIVNGIKLQIEKVDNAIFLAKEQGKGMNNEFSKLFQDIKDAFDVPLNFNAGGFSEFENRIQTIIGLMQLFADKNERLPGLAQALEKAYSDVGDAIKKQNGALNDQTRSLFSLKGQIQDVALSAGIILPDLQEEIRKKIENVKVRALMKDVEVTIPTFTFQKAFDKFRADAQKAIEARGRLDLSKLLGDQSAVDAALAVFNGAAGKAKASLQTLAKEVIAAKLPFTQQEAILKEINDLLGQFAENSDNAADSTGNFISTLSALADGVRGIFNAIDALKGLSKQMKTVLGNTVDLIEATAEFARQAKLRRQAQQDLERASNAQEREAANLGKLLATLGTVSAAIGIIGSTIGIIDTLFGESPQAKEHKDIIRSNNAEIAKLRLAIAGWTNAVSQQANLASLIAARDFAFEFRKTGREALDKQLNELSRAVAITQELGITLQELNEIAKENGIQLLDSKGRIVAGALDQLRTKIELEIRARTTFLKTLNDQRAALELYNRAFQVAATPDQMIKDSLGLLEKLAPELFERFFGSIDRGDTDQVRAATQSLVKALLDGALSATDFGKLLDKQELIQIINGVIDGLDGLKDAADTVSDALLHVPTGFKAELARFNATAIDVMNQISTTLDSFSPEKNKPTVGGPLPSGVTQPIPSSENQRIVMVFEPGAFVIQGQDKTAFDIFEDFTKEAERRARNLGILSSGSDLL